jgi:hypothetical protein
MLNRKPIVLVERSRYSAESSGKVLVMMRDGVRRKLLHIAEGSGGDEVFAECGTGEVYSPFAATLYLCRVQGNSGPRKWD